MRLDKVLCGSGHGSRKEAAALIRKGIVTVNGVIAAIAGSEVNPRQDKILISGRDIDWREFYYIMLNKPLGVISSTDDPKEATVIDLLPERYKKIGLFPVGRLDKDATGLLILTNDGQMAHKMLSPKSHVAKTYMVTVEGEITEKTVLSFNKGVKLYDGTLCRPAGLDIIEEGKAVVTLTEGKYHQIKRMMASCGCHVTSIHRLTMGRFVLDEALEPGGWKRIEAED